MCAVHHHSPTLKTMPSAQLPVEPVNERTIERKLSSPKIPPSQTSPRPLLRIPPPGGRRHARR